MGILDDLLYRVESVNEALESGDMVRDVVIGYHDDIMELQKIQLFQGLASDGNEIRPYYSEDLKPGGYFHSVESAKRYSAWKETGIAYPYSVQRNPDAPNLYINGRFHSELDVEFDPDMVVVIPTTGYAKKIVMKYGLQTFGLMMSNWDAIFRERGGYEKLMDEIKQRIYVN